jgi:hypothetical protein
MFSFGLFSGMWSLIANVSEHCVGSTHLPMKMEQTECLETLAIKLHKYPLAYEDGTDSVQKCWQLFTEKIHSPVNIYQPV